MLRIGVDLGGTKIEALAMDALGNELARQRIPTPRDDYAATVEAVAGLVEALEKRGTCGPRDAATYDRQGTVARVGVGTPGAISPATGLIKNANSVWLNGKPLQTDLSTRLGREVRLANDANCFALSEAVDGAGADARVVFGVILGTGVGGGIVVDKRVLVGPNAVSGEWGHNPLPRPGDGERPGPPCYCGKHGCIESFLSGPGIVVDHEAASGSSDGSPWTAESIVTAAVRGDPQAVQTLTRHTHRLARALAHVINILDPDVMVLGGGLSKIPSLYEDVPRLWGEFVFSDRVDTRLVEPVHGDAGGVRGAAWLWEA